MSGGIDYLREAIDYADKIADDVRRLGNFRFWNRQEGVQIDLGIRHVIVPWSEIQHAHVNVLTLRMDKMIASAGVKIGEGVE